jgi:hypothetical protein
MKFHLLRAGSRFEFRGKRYRKISPLKAAREDDDTQMLIPRSAEVQAIDDTGEPVPEALPDTLRGEAVETELARFIEKCREAGRCIDPPLNEQQLSQWLQAVEAAHSDLKTRLAIG